MNDGEYVFGGYEPEDWARWAAKAVGERRLADVAKWLEGSAYAGY